MYREIKRIMEEHNIDLFDVNSLREIKIEKFKAGYMAFIIGHHDRNRDTIDTIARALIELGYSYFNIFGEQALLWAEAIRKIDGNIKIEYSYVRDTEQSLTLGMMSILEKNKKKIVISDDYCFTEYMFETVAEMISGESIISAEDWYDMRNGLEFTYNGKDAIAVIGEKIIIGYLGEEKEYKSLFHTYSDRIYDGKNFIEMWEDRKMR
ncbi:MAG: hypothetical protein MR314_02085 [Ezakiella sp.]|nr:hypothetical protein [Ezakiella sp.]